MKQLYTTISETVFGRLNPPWIFIAEEHNNIVVILALTGNYQDAKIHFSKALEIHPDYAAALKGLRKAARPIDPTGAYKVGAQ